MVNNGNVANANENKQVNRRTNMQILEDKRTELTKGLETYKQYLDVIPVNKRERFKENFLELATQDYLLSIVEVKELVRFATNVSKSGLDISPSSKEVYIIPFDCKINNQKIMIPQVIIPLNGMQQLAYQKGFFLVVDAVWKLDDGSCEAESKMSRLQQAQLQTANPKWVDAHFIGFDVVLTDLKNELPTQIKFVDKNYVNEATKTIKDNRWKIQTWRHKAVRRAYGDFMIPRDRKIEAFEEVENFNDSILSKTDDPSNINIFLTKDMEDAVTQLGLTLEKKDGVATVKNPQLNHYKTLKALGFENVNNQWVANYDENIIDVEINETTLTQEKQEDTKTVEIKPSVILYKTLLDKGMTKDEIKNFVGDFLGLSKDNDNGINEYLNDEDLLDSKIKEFVGFNDGTTVPEDLF